MHPMIDIMAIAGGAVLSVLVSPLIGVPFAVMCVAVPRCVDYACNRYNAHEHQWVESPPSADQEEQLKELGLPAFTDRSWSYKWDRACVDLDCGVVDLRLDRTIAQRRIEIDRVAAAKRLVAAARTSPVPGAEPGRLSISATTGGELSEGDSQ